jgi:hypothetical protein
VGKNKLACYKKKTGEFVGYYRCQLDAAKELNLCISSINKVIHGSLKSTGGYTFQYVKIDD